MSMKKDMRTSSLCKALPFILLTVPQKLDLIYQETGILCAQIDTHQIILWRKPNCSEGVGDLNLQPLALAVVGKATQY